MVIRVFPTPLSVCKVPTLPPDFLQGELVFVGKSEEELSLVCPTANVTDTALAREDGWQALRIEGLLDFSLVGILAPIATLLAARQISIFALSTYNTDYVLVKERDIATALDTLADAGYTIIR